MDTVKKIYSIEKIKLPELINNFIKNSKEVIHKIKKNNITPSQKIKMLIDDTYLFNLYSSSLILLKLIDWQNEKYILEADTMLFNYNKQFNVDIELLEEIKELVSETEDHNEKMFLAIMGRRMQLYGTECNKVEKLSKLIKMIEDAENNINNMLQKPLNVKVDRNNIDAASDTIMSSVYPDNLNMVLLNKYKYYYLIKRVNKNELRTSLEHQYNNRFNEALPSISKLIILRDIYAKELDITNYYSVISGKTEEDLEIVRMMLYDLNNLLNKKFRNIIIELKSKINKTEKMEFNDIIYALNKLIPEIKVNPLDMLQIVMAIIKRVFNVSFIKKTIGSEFNKNCLCFEMKDKNSETISILYIDLIRKQNKNVNQLTLIKLFNTYGTNVCTQYLLGNYLGLEDNNCNFSDVICMFREFGLIISNAMAVTTCGISENDNEFINFFPDLMENLVYTTSVLEFILKDKDQIGIKNTIRSIIVYRQYEMIINLKLKCANIMFDNLLNTSSDLIDLLKTNKSNVSKILLTTYKNILVEVMKPVEDLFNTEITTIYPQAIFNIINGNAGITYSTILSFIFSYNSYYIMQTQEKVDEFIETVLKNKNFSYRDSIKTFLKLSEEDPYIFFMKNLLKIDPTDNDNYYDEITETEGQIYDKK